MSHLLSALARAPRRSCTLLSAQAPVYRVPKPSLGPAWKFYSSLQNHSHDTMSDLFVELTAPNGRKYKQPRGLFINNEFVKSKSGETITSINPSDETEITSVYAAGPEDVDLAVAAARKALKSPEWRDMDTNARADLLYKFAQLIEEHRETLATIETWDNGKPYQVSFNDDMSEVIGTIKYYAGYANKIHGTVVDTSPLKLAYVVREPVGVCAQIIPYVMMRVAC
ncbi:mitochondrial aldehyde dehydrogenase [Exserohilum turcicum]